MEHSDIILNLYNGETDISKNLSWDSDLSTMLTEYLYMLRGFGFEIKSVDSAVAAMLDTNND